VLLHDSVRFAEAGEKRMLRQRSADVAKRAFPIGLGDPHRSVTCAAVTFQAHFTCVVSRPLTVAYACPFPLIAHPNLTK
jgi:hypothetical protein